MIKEKIKNITNKFKGSDKLLHYLGGAFISFIISNIAFIQEGVIGASVIASPIIGVIAAMLIEFIKEFVFDEKSDKYDIIATLGGAIVPFIANAIGYLFYVL